MNLFSLIKGLSPDLQTMEQIRRIMRPTDVPDTGMYSTLKICLSYFSFSFKVYYAICYGMSVFRSVDSFCNIIMIGPIRIKKLKVGVKMIVVFHLHSELML